jgi:hypothetical protein
VAAAKILAVKAASLTWPNCLVLIGYLLALPACFVLTMCLLRALFFEGDIL